ncbi:MAG: sulfatase, partial [Planctomycetota bacterium]
VPPPPPPRGGRAPALLGVAAGGAHDRARPRNVVLIGIDSLRWDRLGCYGARREISPHIDELAASGCRFERAYTSAPWTMPAVATVLTGQYPSMHGVIRPEHALSDDTQTLAEILSDAGYSTSGVISNRLVGERAGFAQGFERFHEGHAIDHAYISTEGVTDVAVEELRRLAGEERPFLLFAFYFDPHYDYHDHDEIDFAAPAAGRLTGQEKIHQLRALPDMTDEELGFLRDRYDEEIRYTDAGIGRLLATLDELGRRDDTLVVLVSDHGEAFYEHGWLGHVRDLYEELVRVPMIIRDPSAPAPFVATDPVSIAAITPTVVEALGLGQVGAGFQTSSVLPQVHGRAMELLDPVFFEVDFVPLSRANAGKEAHKIGIVHADRKLIRDLKNGTAEHYRLSNDPDERNDLGEAENGAVLFEALDLHQRMIATGGLTAETLEFSDEELETLRDLGYAGD